MVRPLRVALATLALITAPVFAQAPLHNEVSIRTEGDYRIITSNGVPDHKTGNFPNRRNPNAIAEMQFTWRVPLHPVRAEKPIPTGIAWFGVGLNGVPMEPGTQEYWNDDRSSGLHYEAIGGVSDLGIDVSLGHVQPNGAYHYHGSPLGLVEKLGGDEGKMLLVGWAADGFPIYTDHEYIDAKNHTAGVRSLKPSYRLKSGTRTKGPEGAYDGRFTEDYEYVTGLGDLDECNGHLGPTPEQPEGIYHYHITNTFPYISRFWRGEPDDSFQKKGPPPGGHQRKPQRPLNQGGSATEPRQQPARPRPHPPGRPTPPPRPGGPR